MSKGKLGMLLYRLHAWIGLISALFLFVICTTGVVAIYKPEIERAVDWRGYDFNVPHTDRPVSIEHALRSVLAAYPSAEVSACAYPAPPGSMDGHGPTYSFRLRHEGRGIQALVDPSNGRVVAARVGNDGWANWLRQLHVRFLYFGFWGRVVVGFLGVVFLASIVTGLLIYGKFNKGAWWPTVRWDRGARILAADLHKWVGIVTLAFNILFGLTGAVIGLENLAHRYGPRQEQEEERLVRQPVAELPPGMIERCVGETRTLLPGAQPTRVLLTHRRDGCLKVFVEHPAQHLVKENVSHATFDAATGALVQVYDGTGSSAAARFYYAMEPLHFGRFGGHGVKLLWAAMGLSGSFLSASGFVIYVVRKWQRTSTRRVKLGAFRQPAALQPEVSFGRSA